VQKHADAIHGSTRHDVVGRGRHWYTRTGGTVHAFDLGSSAEPRFAGLGDARSVSASDGTALASRVDGGELVVDARSVERHPYGTRYVVDLRARERVNVPEVRPGGAARAGTRYDTITAALADARAGDVVDVGPGRYTSAIGERFPLVVPAGVTLRAAGSLATRRVVIDAGGAAGVNLAGAGARLERVTVTGAAPGYMMVPPTCVIGAADDLGVRDCHLEAIALTGGRGHRVIGNVVAGGAISLLGATGCEVRANYQHGLRWGVGIMVVGGADHVIADNECRDDLCAIRIANAERAHVAHNRIETRWWGVHVVDARDCVVASNRAWRTMRAVNVEGAGASGNVVERQLAEHCDTGVLVERGATGTRIADSWLHDCRVGLLVWEAGSVDVAGVAVSAPRDHAVVSDQPLELGGNDLDGDVWIAP
jgi:hypothetical protein